MLSMEIVSWNCAKDSRRWAWPVSWPPFCSTQPWRRGVKQNYDHKLSAVFRSRCWRKAECNLGIGFARRWGGEPLLLGLFQVNKMKCVCLTESSSLKMQNVKHNAVLYSLLCLAQCDTITSSSFVWGLHNCIWFFLIYQHFPNVFQLNYLLHVFMCYT